jgi:anaerobic magnesium-protoporphyrin IX monomethyl ester cyclase
MSIFLIFPPFSDPSKPYSSIPTLSAYLHSKGINTFSFDANIEFYRKFLSWGNLEETYNSAITRLRYLNNKKELNIYEMLEYIRLFRTLKDNFSSLESLKSLFSENNLSNDQLSDLFSRGINLASTKFFPEWIEYAPNTGFVRFNSRFSKFSIDQILESLNQHNIYNEILEESITKELLGKNIRIAGISIAFPDQILPGISCARIIKKYNPGIHITIGGPFVSYYMRDLKDIPFFSIVDSLVIDDGEIPLEKLYFELKSDKPELRNVPGLIYCRNGHIYKNPTDNYIPLQALPVPDFSVFSLDKYLYPRHIMPLPLRLSKGCYWSRCSFCGVNPSTKSRNDQPPADFLIDLIEEIINQTGIHYFYFTDDAANPDILAEICGELIKRNRKITWSSNMRFDKRLSLEKLALLRQGGCDNLWFGLESYCDRILKLMKKGTNKQLVRKIISNTFWSGIDCNVYMILGFPTETKEEAVYSFTEIKKMKDEGFINDCVYSLFDIAPYSEIFLQPHKFGIRNIKIDKNEKMSKASYQFECDGMHRSEAKELMTSFLLSLTKQNTDRGESGYEFKKTLQDWKLDINYDLIEIGRILNKVFSEHKTSDFLMYENRNKTGEVIRQRKS